MAATRRTARLSATDWVAAAEAAMVEGGLDAVAVEPIARRLGATKGSFYWHFPDRAALVRATLHAWLGRTDELIEELSAITDPDRRLRELFDHVFTDASWVCVETDLFAKVADPDVARVVEESTTRRIGFVAACLTDLGASAQDARDAALQTYSLWIGMLQLKAAVPGVVPAGPDAERYRTATLTLLKSLLPPA